MTKKFVYIRQGIVLLLHLLFALYAAAQPANDNCANPGVIAISGGGFGVGTFTSATVDITGATIQTGETFAPAILVAGQSQKSVWYKFTLPTTRSVRVTLAQSGNAITAGDVGFAVYKTSKCLPANEQISTKLTPIAVFGNTFHPCVDSGEYYVQVSAKNSANGQISIQVETALPTAAYDQPKDASNYGTLEKGVNTISFDVDCQSIEDATEVCKGISNSAQYNKSTWHVFKTPAYFDFIVLMLAQQSYTNQKIGFNIYEGDVRTASYKTLPVVVQCDSFLTSNTYFSRKHFKCDKLLTNKTYSVQLFFHHSFNDKVKLSMALGGTAPTKAPVPVLSGMPSPSNNLGTLPSDANGQTTTASDQLACNSRHNVTACGSAIPKGGFEYAQNGYNYNLSSFFTFNLSSSSNVNFYTSTQECSGQYYLRLYQQAPTNKCSDLDTANIVGQGVGSFNSICLPAGDYTLQVMGRDTTSPESWHSFGSFNDGHYPYSYCFQENLGTKFFIGMTVRTVNTINQFSLNKAGAFDAINSVNGTIKPMVSGTTYTSKADTIGCNNTVLPADTACAPVNTKAVYRQMQIGENGILAFTPNYQWGKLYQGDANALAIAQNAFTFPKRLNGLKPYTECLYSDECGDVKACVVPGTYTYVTFASEANLSVAIRPSFTFSAQGTKYATLATAEDLGTITESKTSNTDIFGCKDNVVAITGYEPCPIRGKPATKAIYRQFYLSKDSRLSITGYHYLNCGYGYTGFMSLFHGKATDGAAGLKPVGGMYNCFQYMSAGQCDILPAGWYTIISYGSGPTFEEPMRDLQEHGYSSYVGYQNQVTINVLPSCPLPKYNRPAKAAIDTLTKQPFLVEWAPRVGNTAAYPKTDTTITLYTENFNCIVDTPFTQHPIPTCDPSLVKTAYYVFRTTQEAYVQIDVGHYWAAVYKGDAREGTTKFDSTTVIQPCVGGQPGKIQLNRLQPGTYTLVIFATAAEDCHAVTPKIYIDRIGYSRFDHATKAYDFGVVPPDSLWHTGRVGDVNPLNKDRAPSDDFIFSTTGAQTSDPADASCMTEVVPAIYSGLPNTPLYKGDVRWNYTIPKRNLWYTFVVKEGGTVRVKVNNRTPGKTTFYSFAVYKSDVNGNLSFANVVSTGAVDSTKAQGLEFITRNPGHYWYYCAPYTPEVSFYREPCNPTPERYYIVVENPSDNTYQGMTPVSQLDVSIQIDSVNAILPKFDHYSTAGNIGANLGSGKYNGPTDNYSCATRDATDPLVAYWGDCSKKTLWYKFTTNVSGNIRYRLKINGAEEQYQEDRLQLFLQVKEGDSTAAGLKYMAPTRHFENYMYWGQNCITPGTYYFLVAGCDRVDQNVFPEIVIEEQAGDYCSAPMVVGLNGAGAKTVSAVINCHTIGTDYGEFNPTLTCPNGALKGDYKTTWYRIDISGKDTLDVTTFLMENTTALPSEIKYRMMEGTCGAMQERSCVQDAQTQDTYKCLPPGSYYIQVFTPVTKNGQPVTGDITLNLSAVKHVDTCAPVRTCLSTAVFLPQYDCTKSEEVTFTNLSTYGTNIQYQWDFGWNGQTSTAVSPAIVYPVLDTDKTYTVKLKVTNNNCPAGSQNTDETSAQIKIPGRPKVNLGRDTTLCLVGSTLKLDAQTWAGTTYKWSTGETTSSITFPYAGSPYDVWVEATYKGCIKRDTINVAINALTRKKETSYLCGNDSVMLSSVRYANEKHLWSTGATRDHIYAKTGGLYINTIDWRGCTIKDSFTVVQAKAPFPKEDTTLCPPFRSFKLNAAAPGSYAYSWQDGTGAADYNVSGPGTYWVQVYYPSCSLRDTIVVKESPAVVRSSKDTTICDGQSYLTSWGQLLTTAGTYRDTVRYATGCDSLVSTVNLKVVAQQTNIINTSICAGQSYTLPWGGVVNTAGTYRDTLRSRGGCDSLLRIVNLQVAKPFVTNTAFTICQGQTYTLPWGKQVSSSGIYRDTLRHVAGCDSLIRVVELKVNPVLNQASSAVHCEGSSYTLPWGEKVTESGTYRHVTGYAGLDCDSLVREVTLRVVKRTVQNTTASVCEGKTFTLPWGTVVTAAGIYRDTVRTAEGCDSLIRSVDLAVSRVMKTTQTVPLCEGSAYTLPSGLVVRESGTFTDTLRAVNGGCDSLIRTIHVALQRAATLRTDTAICSGGTYTLPWGTSVSAAGVYRDTLRYASGCDSVIKVVNLAVNAALSTATTVAICSGESYTLPWGEVVRASGLYKDTIRYASGCDSLIRTVNLNVRPLNITTTSATICSGDSYALPWGGRASATGIYSDTLRYTSGCDSVIRSVDLRVQASVVNAFSVSLCAGQTYTLPSGMVVNTAGVYRDTLRYTTGCDSVQRSITVLVNTPVVLDLYPSICQGQSYQLPAGTVVTTAGIYRDTVRQSAGCDSLYRTITLTIKTAQTSRQSISICEGSNYTLPWGAIATRTGTYRDTLRYTEGCDSLIRVVELTVKALTRQNNSFTICDGQVYTLPWGTAVNRPGLYQDTLRYHTGCDSLIRTVEVVVNSSNSINEEVAVCQGESYTLPWGVTVRESGTYRDTLRYVSGCDSLRRSYTLTFRTAVMQAFSTSICVGNTYTLPWGQVVRESGTYRDTLRYTTGCDSVLRVVDLTVKGVTQQSSTITICQGQRYTLPWGASVSAAGVYRDTLSYTSGCDSIRRTVTLLVQEPKTDEKTIAICSGSSYALPWGQVATETGIYRNTLSHTTGCDSLIRIVRLTVQERQVQNREASICEGQFYTLPWGKIVRAEGIYSDTLRYRTGCDSLIRTVLLRVQKADTESTTVSICAGHSYTLPWGQVVAAAGVYRNVLRYQSGCDSLIRVVTLNVTAAATQTLSASICSDQRYTLPWGAAVNTAGVYRDTVRTASGCDSLVRIVNLQVRQAPAITLSKSNDIDCMLGTARLNASGGARYQWSPAAGLDNATLNNPVASPTTTTTYQVKVTTADGCTGESSITLKVNTGDAAGGYVVPSAFTPNGDGKNDCFGVKHWGTVTDFYITIYDRWGHVVFQSPEPSACWDGTLKGQPLQSEVFVYLISAKTVCGPVLRKGTVTLIR